MLKLGMLLCQFSVSFWYAVFAVVLNYFIQNVDSRPVSKAKYTGWSKNSQGSILTAWSSPYFFIHQLLVEIRNRIQTAWRWFSVTPLGAKPPSILAFIQWPRDKDGKEFYQHSEICQSTTPWFYSQVIKLPWGHIEMGLLGLPKFQTHGYPGQCPETQVEFLSSGLWLVLSLSNPALLLYSLSFPLTGKKSAIVHISSPNTEDIIDI